MSTELPAITAAEQRAAEALWKSGACEPQEAAALARIALTAALPGLTGAITAQATTTEREACALLADYYAEQIACHECGSEAAYSAASLIRSRSGLLGGTADGAHTPGGAT